MKTVAVSKDDPKLHALVGSAQKQRVVLTRAGKPSAILIGIESYDDEDIELATSPEFWRLIESRRRGRTVPLSELKSRLFRRSALQTAAKRATRKSARRS